MEKFIGRVFTGTISSITNFGVFVVLDNTVEGLIRYSSMHDDYYSFDEKRMRIVGDKHRIVYSLGDRVSIRVMDASKELREIEFRLLGKEAFYGDN